MKIKIICTTKRTQVFDLSSFEKIELEEVGRDLWVIKGKLLNQSEVYGLLVGGSAALDEIFEELKKSLAVKEWIISRSKPFMEWKMKWG